MLWSDSSEIGSFQGNMKFRFKCFRKYTVATEYFNRIFNRHRPLEIRLLPYYIVLNILCVLQMKNDLCYSSYDNHINDHDRNITFTYYIYKVNFNFIERSDELFRFE